MSEPELDLIVVGGGPAGLGTALHAARAGLCCVVVEPRTAPVDKACGEGLMPAAVRALAALDVRPAGHPFAGIRYVDGARSAESRFPTGLGMGVRRTVLHSAMHEAVRAAGVEVLAARVDVVRQRDGWVEAAGLRARYLVGADGLHSRIRSLLGLERHVRGPVRYGLRRHYATTAWTDLVEVHWGGKSELYVTPVDEHTVGVAVLGPRGSSIDAALAEHPRLAARLGATVVTTDRGSGPLRRASRARRAGRVLLVGDAAGYVDAITGEGVALALDQAAAAVDCVLHDEPQRYEARWRDVTRSRGLATAALVAAASTPVLRRRIVATAAAFPRGFDRCVAGLGGS